MKRLNLLLAAALAVAACSPETFTMNVEMRYPSKSGLDFSRKTLAVVYQDDGAQADSTFLRSVANGFARKLEEDYFAGQEAIRLFHVPLDTVKTIRKSFLQDLVLDTGEDVVFFFGEPEFGAIGTGASTPSSLSARDSAYLCPVVIPFKLKVYTYDSLNKDDKVLYFNGSTAVRPQVFHDGAATYDQLVSRAWNSVGPLAENVGAQATGNFVSTWKAERFSFYYFEYAGTNWDRASQAAYEYRWADAIKYWTALVQSYTRSSWKRACAEYNLASAFYILGNYDLATRWLDRADADGDLALSPGLRKRIASRTK